MKEIFKINSLQIYNMWRNVACGILALTLMLLVTVILPSYLAPVVSTLTGFIFYLIAYTENNRRNSCMLQPSAVLVSIIVYTIVLIVLNICTLWIESFDIWFELSFFTSPYVPILLLAPSVFVTSVIMYIRGEGNSACTDCKLINGHYLQRGQIGPIMHRQSKNDLKNLIVVFGFLTLTSWLYFFFGYNSVNYTARDTFVFDWFPIIILVLDIFYLAKHYYEIFLDLQQLNLVLSPQEINDMSPKTWVRFYVICEDSMYLNLKAPDVIDEKSNKTMVETPFIVSRESEGISEKEATALIHSLTGVRDGELRFFFGRKSADNFKHNIIRFFYFLPGEVEMYPHLKDVTGNWISSNKFKTLRYANPSLRLSPLLRVDMTRLATILITSKTFNEKGERRTKLKQYHPSFNFEELKNCKIDFQDNQWLRISTFNSNTPFFKLKRFWRNVTHRNKIPVDE